MPQPDPQIPDSQTLDPQTLDPQTLPTTLQLAAVTLAMQHPVTRTWGQSHLEGDDERLPRLAQAHAFDLELATSLEIARQRAERFAFAGLEAEAYLNRWQAAGNDLTALLSIRFEGLDRTKPFVDLSGTSRPWTPADFPALKRAALEVYGAFSPKYLRLSSAVPVDALTGPDGLTLGRDMRFVAAPVSELAGIQVSAPPELRLRLTTDHSHLAQAEAAYVALNAQHPTHAGQAQVLDAEQLQEAIDAGLMFDVLVGQKWAGYVGVLPESELGLEVYTVQELLLTPEYRGRGYGQLLTTLLARAILAARPEEPGRVLFGTIHADNAGAYPAALRAGRVDVGGWVRLGL